MGIAFLIIGSILLVVFASIGGFLFATIALILQYGGGSRFQHKSPLKRKNIHISYHWIDSDEYREYLQSDAWKAKRRLVLEFLGSRCVKCGISLSETTANIHHLTYERVKKELVTDLIPLCKTCHKDEHKKTSNFKPEIPLGLSKRIKQPLTLTTPN